MNYGGPDGRQAIHAEAAPVDDVTVVVLSNLSQAPVNEIALGLAATVLR